MLRLKKDKLWNQKILYLVLIVVILLGMGTALFYQFFLGKDLKGDIVVQMNQFFTSIKDGNLNFSVTLQNSLSSNGISLFVIWIFGISIIGIPFILIHLFLKSFILFFSFVSIIANYHFKGIFLSIVYIFPHQIVNLVIWLLLSFYAVGFSIKLIQVLFLKRNINLKEHFKKYTKILVLCMIGLTISSFFETYLCPWFLKFFLK
ncbi:MAG: hypothetical protein HFG40_01580 [Bacilli bacterium]|nr:hypothetical protein [Bacilli bacterium]